jgi:hypothetical protein
MGENTPGRAVQVLGGWPGGCLRCCFLAGAEVPAWEVILSIRRMEWRSADSAGIHLNPNSEIPTPKSRNNSCNLPPVTSRRAV